MEITLTRSLEAFIEDRVRSGRYADASDVVRDALRALEARDLVEPPALEAALLEGVESAHEPYTPETLDRVRRAGARR